VVQETGGSGITKIDWSVNGALEDVEATADQGTTEDPLPVPYDISMPTGTTAGYLSFYWGNDGGEEEKVEADVFFADGKDIEEEVADNIVTPTVNSFTRTYQPIQIRDLRGKEGNSVTLVPGLSQGTQNLFTGNYTTAGNVFNASVSGIGANGAALPQGGTIFIEQTVRAIDTFKYSAALAGVNPPANTILYCNSTTTNTGYVIDEKDFMLDGPPTEYGGVTLNVLPGVNNQTYTSADSPNAVFPAASFAAFSSNPQQPYVIQINTNKMFVTTLMFKPNNGVALPLQNMSWNFKATMTLNTQGVNPVKPSGNAATDIMNLRNVKNWTLAAGAIPAAAGKQNGQQTKADPKFQGHTEDNGKADPSTFRSFNGPS
jgi:hypothetical protein